MIIYVHLTNSVFCSASAKDDRSEELEAQKSRLNIIISIHLSEGQSAFKAYRPGNIFFIIGYMISLAERPTNQKLHLRSTITFLKGLLVNAVLPQNS